MFNKKNKELTDRINDLKEQNKFLKDMVKDLQSQVFILMNKNNEYIQAKNVNRIEDIKEIQEINSPEIKEMHNALLDVAQDI